MRIKHETKNNHYSDFNRPMPGRSYSELQGDCHFPDIFLEDHHVANYPNSYADIHRIYHRIPRSKITKIKNHQFFAILKDIFWTFSQIFVRNRLF